MAADDYVCEKTEKKTRKTKGIYRKTRKPLRRREATIHICCRLSTKRPYLRRLDRSLELFARLRRHLGFSRFSVTPPEPRRRSIPPMSMHSR